MNDYSALFGDQGPLAKRIEGYRARPQQIEMATAVEQVIDDSGVLIAEAGTGTGKTFAYLVPAVMSGLRVIVSTGTKALQDQLFQKDVPLVLKALGAPIKATLLKGRANYLCLQRTQRLIEEGRLRSREQVADLTRISHWSERTRSGDIAEVTDVDEGSPLWPMVTSTTDNCLGQDCPVWDDCYLVQARREAQEADLVVINHHLLFADMVLKEEGFGDLLPGADLFVLDEAHQLAEIASNFFGESLGARQLLELARDAELERIRDAKDATEISDRGASLEKAVRDLRLCFGTDSGRGTWRDARRLRGMDDALQKLQQRLDELREGLDAHAERGKGIEACAKRALELASRLKSVTGSDSEDSVQWYETFSRTFSLNRTPLEIGESFTQHMERYQSSWVFTSATLAVGDSFEHFKQSLGIESTHEGRWESPFDFRRQAVLYVPEALDDPRSESYTRQVVEAGLPVLKASRGRAFMLFTSHRALREAARLLEDQIDYPLLVQGAASKGELLRQFREAGSAILLGTSSFWEGVDVRGEALSLVIIDKLPFASPGDPVLQARIDAMQARGQNPFWDFQVPHAVIGLKQGVGRLIRDLDDTGVLMLCDPRLLTKSYGKVFLRSLPPMTRTRKLEVVERFFDLEQRGELKIAEGK